MPSRKKKGNEKAKQKKKERKERSEREKLGKEKVKSACKIEDIFTILTAFKSFKKLGLEFKFKRYNDLLPEEKTWTFDLLQRNMKDHYQKCEDIGWNEANKKKELEHEDCRYILAYRIDEAKKTGEGKENQEPLKVVESEGSQKESKLPVGYVMWRFLMDDNGMGEMLPVLYLWEIHIEAEYRRKGLGKFLMTISELAAWKLSMKKIILTAFTSNPASIKFFTKKLKFQYDETDPKICDPEDPCGYRILSKCR